MGKWTGALSVVLNIWSVHTHIGGNVRGDGSAISARFDATCAAGEAGPTNSEKMSGAAAIAVRKANVGRLTTSLIGSLSENFPQWPRTILEILSISAMTAPIRSTLFVLMLRLQHEPGFAIDTLRPL